MSGVAEAAPARGEALAPAAIFVAAVVSEYSLLIMPFIVGAAVDGYGISESFVSEIVALHLLGMTAGSLVVSLTIDRLNARAAVVLAGLAIAVANALCAAHVPLAGFIAARAGTGIGEGMMMALSGAAAGRSRSPETLFTAIGFGVAAVAAIVLYAVPYLSDAFGRGSVFGVSSGLGCLAAAAALPWFPSLPLPRELADWRHWLTRRNVLILLGFAALWSSASSLWVYAEAISTGNGLTLEQVGTDLSIAQIFGLAGPPLVLALRARSALGMVQLIFLGLAMCLVGAVVFVEVRGTPGCLGGAILMSIATMFLNPCFRSLMAAVDAQGRVVAASVAFYTIGYGFAPFLIGWALLFFAQTPVILSASIGFLAIAALSVWGGRVEERRAAP
ncbi:MAG TPA: MFS transporter [Stellaceae bacterium]|nr:MFS transporter [Stellaceae bacterium]